MSSPSRYPYPLSVTLAGVAVGALLITALAYAYYLDSRVLARPLSQLTVTDIPTPRVEKPRQVLIPVAQMRALALMGKQVVEPKLAPVPMIEEIPDTQLNLTLMGVFASQDVAIAAALIKVGSESPKYFRVGQDVVPGTKLEIVAADGVTLRSEQAYEKLMFAHSGIWSSSPATSLAELQPKQPVRFQPAPAERPDAVPASFQAQKPATSTPARVASTDSVAHLTLQERLARLRANMPYHQ